MINTPAPRSYSLCHSRPMFCFSFFGIICCYHGNTLCHCPKICPTHLHFKANMCAKFNLKMLFPLNCWHMLLPWQHIFPHSSKSFLHIYTSSPTCKPNFFWIACEFFCLSVFWIINCYHGNTHPATVPKCVMHSYTSMWTCMPNLIWNAFPPQFLA